MGIPEFEAKQYEAKIKEGNILISVHAEDGDVIDRVKDIMKVAGRQTSPALAKSQPE